MVSNISLGMKLYWLYIVYLNGFDMYLLVRIFWEDFNMSVLINLIILIMIVDFIYSNLLEDYFKWVLGIEYIF